MTTPTEGVPWEGQVFAAASRLAEDAARLRDNKPYDASVLDELLTDLVSELLDRGFSVREIKDSLAAASDSQELKSQ